MNSAKVWVEKLNWSMINEACEFYKLDPRMIGAIIQCESMNNPMAARFEPHYKYLYEVKKNALSNGITEATETVLQMTSFGLCQVMGAVARELGLSGMIFHLLDPVTNLEYACRLLKRIERKYQEPNDIIASYNAGSVIRTTDGKYKNQTYVDRVRACMSLIDMHKGK